MPWLKAWLSIPSSQYPPLSLFPFQVIPLITSDLLQKNQIKATIIKIERNWKLTKGLKYFGKILPISASFHITVSRLNGFFWSAMLKQKIYAWKLRACQLAKVWLSGLRFLRARQPNQSLMFQVNCNSLTSTQKAADKHHCCLWHPTALVVLYNILFCNQDWASSKVPMSW